MNTKHVTFTLVALILITACTATPTPTPTALPTLGMANPASVYCEEQGNRLEIRTAPDGSQSGVCIFPDGSECDEWAYFRGECGPTQPGVPTEAPTSIPTAVPIDPSAYQGWWTYTNPVYNFSIMLPEDWKVDETTGNDPLMNGHLLMLHPEPQVADLQIRMTFRRVGEDTLLWPTGVGAGQFIPQGTLEIAGQPARRVMFVCPAGQVNEIWYHDLDETQPNIQRGNMEFGFIFSLTGFYCEEGHSLSGKTQWLGEMIIASLKAQ
jgi:putative hemolysin